MCKLKEHTTWKHQAPALDRIWIFDLIELDTNCSSAQTGLPVKTAPIENGPVQNGPNFRLQRPHIKIRRSKRPKTEKSMFCIM